MTREEWLESIAADTGIPVEQLLAKRAQRGPHPEPCDCGEGICQGWRWSDPPDDDDVPALPTWAIEGTGTIIHAGTVTKKLRRGTTLIIDKDGVRVRPRWWWRLIRRGGRVRWSS